ncbi:hypothetical protein BIY22_15235 [Vibrio panuliri]|uniref:Type IV pilin n=1 Tax=Vibrio panuliri TaxID=1381081 RepID=A0A1Q9HP94_9VIBR|nr:prepilin-type N-terminal cleavage/methylation domain-containing protein [Vibrio panuliri]OLQ92674.1 hypothetical protein BIY22_15235 [Vibrio panuliri]
MITKQKGFSLLEVLLAFTLISIATLGLLKLQITLQQKADFILQQTQALHFAEQQMERFISRANSVSAASGVIAFSELGEAVNCGTHLSALSGSIYTLECQVSTVSGVLEDVMRKVTVKVSWVNLPNQTGESNGVNGVLLQTNVSKFGEFDM